MIPPDKDLDHLESCEPPQSLREDTEARVRELLWVNHGCAVTALYGDDGERQCHVCKVDFKRYPLPELLVFLFARGRLHAGPLATATLEPYAALKRIANEMQVASSRGRAVSAQWLDRRIAVAREALAKAEGRQS